MKQNLLIRANCTEAREEHVTKWRLVGSCRGGLNVEKISIPPELIDTFGAIPIKILIKYWGEFDKIIPNFI